MLLCHSDVSGATAEAMEGICLDVKRFILAVLRSILPHNSLNESLKSVLLRLHKVSTSAEYAWRPGDALTEAGGIHEAGLCPHVRSLSVRGRVDMPCLTLSSVFGGVKPGLAN